MADKRLDVCGLHGAYRGQECLRCAEAWRPDEPLDGEALPPVVIGDRHCDCCGQPVDYGWICPRCSASDEPRFTRLFGSSL